MQVERLTLSIMPSLIELAREMEPLFEGSMAENKDFHDFVKLTIAKNESFMVRDEVNPHELMGIIAISRADNEIGFLAVFEKHRGKGIGARLLAHALNELDNTKEISVVTFHEDNAAGIPARKLYLKFGFTDFDTNYIYDGHRRCVMKWLPKV